MGNLLEIPKLTKQDSIKDKIEQVSVQVINGEKDIFDTSKEMGVLIRKEVSRVVENIIIEFNLDKSNLPFAIFLFGSPARNSMLPNSDLDIGLVFQDTCLDEVKNSLKKRVSDLPFDKIDIAGWSTIEEMCKDRCTNMIEYSKATDARFIAGNPILQEQYNDLVKGKDTREDKVSRFVTEFGIFHKFNYLSKWKKHNGPNLKYDFGASRDLIFLDWYFILNENSNFNDTEPFFLKGLNSLENSGLVSAEEKESLKSAARLVLLVKFILRYKSVKENNDEFSNLSNYSLDRCFQEGKKAFTKIGISSVEDLIREYYDAKLKIYSIVQKMYKVVSASNPQLLKVWGVARDSVLLSPEVVDLLQAKRWPELIAFAVESRSSDIIEFLTNLIANIPGYEYVLRIIASNPSLNDKTKSILRNSIL